MAGMLFVVCVPTSEFEKYTLYGPGNSVHSPVELSANQKVSSGDNVVLAEQEGRTNRPTVARVHAYRTTESPSPCRSQTPGTSEEIPMEQILGELLKKLQVEHVVWNKDKSGNFYQVCFLVGAGDPCENCIHCLTELGIGRKLNSVVSVIPCSVFFQGVEDDLQTETFVQSEKETAQKKKWNNFVQSIRSKLTVKQVVDGVRGGAECSFDYLLLVLTADMVAAVGLVENNSVNIVAAMLISPLMGPIMAGTFGTVIADWKLLKIGIRSELIGLFLSLIFGFIFGLFVGTTKSPWGYGDWPTEEMKARGNARSLWIGVLWALPSGTGVALALLQGSAGPLIGVAISASLLPPIVNCGIMWGLACIVLMYDNVKIPYSPSDLAVMGIISFCLTLINICCIFLTAIIVLKIKEVAAPYTSSPDLRRFWEHDIRIARDTNRSTMRRTSTRRNTDRELMQDIISIPTEELSSTLDAAVREAMEDSTFRKVKRVSYCRSSADVTHALGLSSVSMGTGTRSSVTPSDTSHLNDVATLDQVIQALIGHQKLQQQHQRPATLTRFHPLSRSLRHGSTRSNGRGSARNSWLRETPGQSQIPVSSSSSGLPTILESNSLMRNSSITRTLSLSERTLNAPIVKNLLHSLGSTTQRFAVSPAEDPLRNSRYYRHSEETVSLTQEEDE